jgi:hypothetical protein
LEKFANATANRERRFNVARPTGLGQTRAGSARPPGSDQLARRGIRSQIRFERLCHIPSMSGFLEPDF